MTEIYEKLSRIQQKLIAPKGQKNDFGKYNYRSCEDILKALKPLTDENRCVVFITNELVEIGGRHYVEATVTLADLDSDGVIVSKAQAREEAEKKGMDASQITGAASSYARKYALAGLFCIDNEKDSDATNESLSQKDIKNLEALCKKANVNIPALCEQMHIKSFSDMTAEQYTQIAKMVDDALTKKGKDGK